MDKPVKSARLYATALGAYGWFLNQRCGVGDQVLAPGWTDYRERVVYQTYDVTDQIVQGKNAISAMLAPGWYETPLEWFQQPNNYGVTPPALRAQLRIEHTDGSVEWVTTDASWQAARSSSALRSSTTARRSDMRSPVRRGRVPVRTLRTIGSSERAAVIDPAPVKIVAQDFPPIRVERTLEAEVADGAEAGSLGLRLRAELLRRGETAGAADRSGHDVRMRFAEVLNPDGTIYTDNLRTAKATDHFLSLTGDPRN